MSHVSDHEVLHAALGEQVAHLPIGVSPTAAVLKDGASLRGRRRLALAAGVAALAMLPIAMIAAFAPGDGSGAISPGAGINPPDPNHLDRLHPLASPTDIGPQTDSRAKTVAPAATDEVRVLADGTIDGQHWRLVRVRYVVGMGDTAAGNWGGGAGQTHLPLSELSRVGAQECEYLGVQWGDRPAGTTPDYGFSGTCGRNAEIPGSISSVLIPIINTNLPASRRGAVTVVTARVDGARVASATVAVDGHISARQPIIKVPGEYDGYSVFLVDPAYDEAGQPMLFTVYGANGKALESQPLAASVQPTH